MMNENENELIEQAPQEITQEPVEQQQVVQNTEQKETDQERNFKELRLAKARAEKERDEAYRLVKEYEASLEAKDDDLGIKDDDLAEGRHLSKIQKKIKNLEQKVSISEQKNYEIITEQKLKAKYPDFDKVVTSENIAALSQKNPAVARMLASSPDLETAGESAYLFIKQFVGTPSTNYNDREKEIVQKNFEKPRPLTSVSPQQGDSPLTRANAFASGLTDDLREQLKKEMFEARKQF